MRRVIVAAWCFVPILFLGFHFGAPGKRLQTLDQVDHLIRQAKHSVAQNDWEVAVEQFDAAMGLVPPEMVTETRQIMLEKCKAQMMAKQLPQAHSNLQAMLDDMLAEPTDQQDDQLIRETRSSLANSQYYMTWLMRLEGEPEERWMPELESARQHYKLISEQLKDKGDAVAAKKFEEDLESSIKLARMDLSELQGLPLPSQ
eukprot:TRINITY_DN23737_c1_g1_i1.p1 TRINITY_DN23737_c1_g1~~TRINITY_DN23737_c1_g1_i1.p1  ORF type:complete len:201 (-),score=29.28 TRINITY_DN23737_c1_g1_i1:215-817(-)